MARRGEPGTARSPGRRAFLLVLLLAAGGAAVLPEAFAQTTPDPAKWSRFTTDYLQFELPNGPLFATATQQTVRVAHRQGSGQDFRFKIVFACSLTTVTPANLVITVNDGTPSNCRIIRNRSASTDIAPWKNANYTPNATEIANGGVVMLWATVGGGSIGNPNVTFDISEWIPLSPPPGVTVDTDLMTTGAQATTLAVTEPLPTPDGSEAKAYTLVLTTAPSGPVTATSDDAAVEVDTDGTPASRMLTFSANSWNTAQTVTATAVADANGVGETVTVAHAVTSADGNYNGVSVASVTVTVTVTDDDTRGVTLSATALPLYEDSMGGPGAGTYTVVLETEPTAEVMITVRSDDAQAVSRAPTVLTFTVADWETAQPVTATAVADADANDEAVTLTHTLTGADYGANTVTVADVTVTVADDEAQAVWVDTAATTRALTVAEDGDAAYPVTLGSAPTADVVVRIASGGHVEHGADGDGAGGRGPGRTGG